MQQSQCKLPSRYDNWRIDCNNQLCLFSICKNNFDDNLSSNCVFCQLLNFLDTHRNAILYSKMGVEKVGEFFQSSDGKGILLVNKAENALVANYIIDNITKPGLETMLYLKHESVQFRRGIAVTTGIVVTLSVQTTLAIPNELKFAALGIGIGGSIVSLLTNYLIDRGMKRVTFKNER